MFRKQIQKSIFIGLLALILFSLFPVFGVKAEDPPRGPAEECKIRITNSNLTGTSNTKIYTTHEKIIRSQKFSVYVQIDLSTAETDQCEASGSKSYEIALFMYNAGLTGCNLPEAYSYQRSYPLTFNKTAKNFNARIDNLSYDLIFRGNINSGVTNSFCLYAYLHKTSNRTDLSYGYAEYPKYIELSYATVPFPPSGTIPTGSNPIDASSTTIDQSQSIPGSTLKLSFVKKGEEGLRDKYRLVKTDGDMNFGATNGLDAILMDWPQGGPRISPGQHLALTARADYSIGVEQDPQYRYTRLYFADGTGKFDSNKACQAGSTSEGCNLLYSNEWGNSNGNKGRGSTSERGTITDEKFDPILKTDGWNKPKYVSMTSSDGKPLGTEKLYVIPVMWGQAGVSVPGFGYSAYLIGNNPQSFTIEIYEKIEHVIAACKAENPSNEAFCTPENSRYKVGKLIEATVSSSEKDSNNAVSQSLYAFIVRVISDIIVWLQSVIYRIFAYILVPVLKALLSVRPYQDTFVNIIYPGWLIIRNLANIFFIVSLLLVGLRILFQQSDSSIARSFILRLVIMALLVNFSLVIAQGIVGIADTVQSQFLPSESKVIEALGAKLMVEPLKAFRAEVLDNTNGGGFTGEQAQLALADTIKPLVLLLLSVAAFWAFVAMAAFLLVRLVVLWILYMVSPFAYFGTLIDYTKPHAERWWTEFIKYAMITPILAFFLNIAALMATAFAGSNNSLFKVGDGSTSSDLVIGTLTIISHFIVLGVMFAGIKLALSFGTVGGQAITNFAKKGFKKTFSGANALKDYAVDKAATAAEKTGKPGWEKFAKAITATSKPITFGKALKKAQLDDPKKEREEREAKRLASLAGSKSKGNVLKKYWDGIKDKGLGDEDPTSLEKILTKSAKGGDRQAAGEAMLQLGKTGNFDEILESAKSLTGRTYAKNAAGLNQATRDLQTRLGFSNEERNSMLANFDSQARKDKGAAHYAGNTYRDDKGNIKILEVNQNDPSKFADTNRQNEYVNNQAKRRAKLGLVDDLKQSNINAMVEDGPGGKRFTDSQVKFYDHFSNDALANPDTRNRLSQLGQFGALQEAFQNSRNEFSGAKLRALDQLFGLNQGGGGGNQGGGNYRPPIYPNAGGNQGGGNAQPTIRAGGNTVVRAQVTQMPPAVTPPSNTASLGQAYTIDQPSMGQVFNNQPLEVGNAGGFTSSGEVAGTDNSGGASGALRNSNRAGFFNDWSGVSTQKSRSEPEYKPKLGDQYNKYDDKKPPTTEPKTPAAPIKTSKVIPLGDEYIKDKDTGKERRRAVFASGKAKAIDGADTAPSGVSRLFPDKKEEDKKTPPTEET